MHIIFTLVLASNETRFRRLGVGTNFCVRCLLPIFRGGGGIKTLSPQKQDPLSMSDLNLHPPPPSPLGVLLAEMRGCPTTFGIGRGAGGFDANRGGINAGSGYSNW